MERDFEKDIIELDAAIKSNAERDNTFTLSVLQRAKELLLQQKEIIENYEGVSWIPVAERLPPEPKVGMVDFDSIEDYIVMIEGAVKPTFLAYAGDGEWYRDGVFYRVISWMPLPESYNPQN